MTTPTVPLRSPRLRRPETIPAGLHIPVGKSLRPAVQRIVQELNPEKIVLFGSYAYGSPTPEWRTLEIDPRHLNTLTDHAVRTRYPGNDPTTEDARDAIEYAKLIRSLARKFLGL
jgi:hypothetical protein